MGNENSSEEPTVRPPGAGHVYQWLVLLGCYTKLLNSADWPYWCYWYEHWINCISGLNDSLVWVSSDSVHLCTFLCVGENVCLCLVSTDITGIGYSVTAGAAHCHVFGRLWTPGVYGFQRGTHSGPACFWLCHSVEVIENECLHWENQCEWLKHLWWLMEKTLYCR